MMAEGSDRLRKEGTIQPQAKISDRQHLLLNVIENRSKGAAQWEINQVLVLCVCVAAGFLEAIKWAHYINKT